MMTHMLRGVLERGTGRTGRLEVPAVGKTGTTDGYRDAWFAGYTPDLVAVVWVGFDHGRALGLPGSQAALPIWAEFMKAATAGRPAAQFDPPEGITLVRIDPHTGGLATPECPEVLDEAFPVGRVPTATCPMHRAALTGSGPTPEPEPPTPQPKAAQRGWWPF